MTESENKNNQIANLLQQLTIARSEVSNLRKQINSFVMHQRKEIKSVTDVLSNWQCEYCKNTNRILPQAEDGAEISRLPEGTDKIEFEPIGFISTTFKEKRAVPRQPTLGSTIQGCITINPETFTNPDHSLEGLEDFSHMWILFHFHKNPPHSKAKIAPPRLNGKRIGVFSCRSPHRPCPIGLSLVQIDRIEGSSIYFFGTDMVDGTPVLDIKPYIKQYDDPNGAIIDSSAEQIEAKREEPDGEESIVDLPATTSTSAVVRKPNTIPVASIKEADWVKDTSKLQVLYTDTALKQILDSNVKPDSINEILSSDPRSVYLRTNYGSQFFTFQIGECAVTSKFDDNNSTVTVLKINKKETFQNAATTTVV